jgi:hypothetical protein
MAITQNTANKKPMSVDIQSNVAKKLKDHHHTLLQPVKQQTNNQQQAKLPPSRQRQRGLVGHPHVIDRTSTWL